MSKRTKKTFWVEKISLFDVLFFLAQSLATGCKVNYSKYRTGFLAAGFLGFLGKTALKRVFSPVELPIRRVDKRGQALIYKVDAELDLCIENFLSNKVLREPARFKEMLKSYLATNLQKKAVFINMVEAEVSFKKDGEERNIICLKSHPFNYLLGRFYQNRNFDIQYKHFSLSNLLFYLRPLGYLCFFFCCRVPGFKVKTNIPEIRPAVWVEYYPSPWHSFWLKGVKNEDFDIVTYLDRKDTPADAKTIKNISDTGVKWIDAHFCALIRMSRLGFSGFVKLLREFFSVYFSGPDYLKVFNFQYIFLLLIYESVFARYKVKVLIQHQEASWKQQVQALAIERAGGIMVGYHWSAYQYWRVPTHIFPQHVYFVWGRIMSDLLRKKSSRPSYVLPSGIWIVPGKDNIRKETVFDKKVDFVVSVFDSTVEYDSFLPPFSLSEFYLRILNIIKGHPGFGCVIKSKLSLEQTFSYIPRGEKIMEIVEMLKRQNRIVVLDFNAYPLDAALYSDLSVGYDINSACVVVSTVSGLNSISWDSSGYRKHPFYALLGQQVVFGTLEEIEEAILKASRGDKAIGDFKSWKKHFNHFEDYSAISRMRGFLEFYMGQLKDAKEPAEALGLAVKKYLNDNKVDDDFYSAENLWGGSGVN